MKSTELLMMDRYGFIRADSIEELVMKLNDLEEIHYTLVYFGYNLNGGAIAVLDYGIQEVFFVESA